MAIAEQRLITAGPTLGYQSLRSEVCSDSLPVSGALPSWLRGTLLRNGPALFEDAERPVRHWFDGQAMLHRFTFADGRVGYGNRFLRTKAYRAMSSGRLAFSEFATDPCRSIFKRAMTVFDPQVTDNAMVSLTKLGERHYAMTEAPISVQFDPGTLETLGYSERVPGTFATAHPHRDPASGALVNIATRMGARNSYRFFAYPPTGSPSVIATKSVREPGYVHSFAMTDRYLALIEFPFVVDPKQIVLSGRPFIENFRWEPERGTRILVFDRHSGAELRVLRTEPGFAFHHVGAWEEGDELVIEYCDHGTPEIIDALYLDKLRSPTPGTAPPRDPPRLRRLTIDLGSGQVSSTIRSDQGIEMPRINEPGHYLRRYRYVYGTSSSPERGYDAADRLIKLDNEIGTAQVWTEPDVYVGEPVFVPAPSAADETDGVLLSVVLDAGRRRSSLVVLDATSMTELARAQAPHVIPHGIHGDYYAAAVDPSPGQ